MLFRSYIHAVETGLLIEMICDPQHEYTKELLAAVPVVGGKRYYA